MFHENKVHEEYELNAGISDAYQGCDPVNPAYWTRKVDVLVHSAVAPTSTAVLVFVLSLGKVRKP